MSTNSRNQTSDGVSDDIFTQFNKESEDEQANKTAFQTSNQEQSIEYLIDLANRCDQITCVQATHNSKSNYSFSRQLFNKFTLLFYIKGTLNKGSPLPYLLDSDSKGKLFKLI